VNAALLLLADGRSPTGSYAHSGGVEAAIDGGWIRDVDDLRVFLAGRLATVGRVAAGLAAAAADPDADLAALDGEADARTLSPAARAASRAQGRALLRMIRTSWPSERYTALGPRPHAGLALGVAASVAGAGPADAATLAATAAVSGPASAALRLLGLDPLAVAAMLAGLSADTDRAAASAAADVAAGVLPDDGAPHLDVMAEAHVEGRSGAVPVARMFAS
jgi:urease accessory protein